MPQYASFDDFARDVFLLRLNSEVRISDQKFKPIPLMDDAARAFDYFQDGHSTYLKNLFSNHEYREFKNEEQFFKFAIPRCLKLIDSGRYFYSLLLVGSFIIEFVRYLKDTRYCYRFCYAAHKCFLAVFKRALADGFEPHGGFEGIGKFSKATIESVNTLEKYRYLPNVINDNDPNLKEKVIKLIEECDVDEGSFQLNAYELSLLKDDIVDHVLEAVENDVTGDDPLDLRWPPGEDVIEDKVERTMDAFVRKSAGIFYAALESGEMDNTAVEEIVVLAHPELSDLFKYIYSLERETKELLGPEVFQEKLEHRKCPCCGIKCYQVTLKLYLKQLLSALVDDSDTKKDS